VLYAPDTWDLQDIVSRSNTVALDFGRALFGPPGAILFSCMVAVSCFGALNSVFFATSRLIYAAGREGFLPEIFSQLHTTRKTPVNATALQLAITLLYVVLGGGFRSLLNFYSVATWGFYFLTVLGLVILRIKEPFLERWVSSGSYIGKDFNLSHQTV
jgi:amino acid transporter